MRVLRWLQSASVDDEYALHATHVCYRPLLRKAILIIKVSIEVFSTGFETRGAAPWPTGKASSTLATKPSASSVM